MILPPLTIKSARSRLTFTYLAIIMVMSLSFSTVFYMQSVSEAKSNLQRQAIQLNDFIYFATPEGLRTIQERQLDLFKNNLAKKLVLLNAGMLVMGGAVSYMLARRSLRPLEEALLSQSRFTSDAAHELRTPLTVMKTENEVALKSRSISSKEAKEIIRSNLEEISKLESLTSGLLRLAKSTEMVDRTHYQAYRISDILKAAYARLEDKAKDRRIVIKLPRTKLAVYGDCDQLVELFVPLVGNAIKYSPEDSEVIVAAYKEDSFVRVDITDQGIGIAEVDLPHIFERFYRADQSRNKVKIDGYGLGLSLAEAIAKAHQGKILAKSRYGEGSIFTVLLPKAD